MKGPNRKIRPFLFLAGAWVLALASLAAAVPVPAEGENPPIQFHSFINVGYRHLPKLQGWQTTRDVIRETLVAQGLDRNRGCHAVDGTPQQLREFLSQLPLPPAGGVQVVYLASQQSPDGCWEFTRRERVSWRDLMPPPVALEPAGHGLRLVLLDSCYAAVAAQMPGWQEWAPLTLCAAGEKEVTWEIDFDKKQPRDFRVRLAGVWDWLATYYAGRKWSHRVSFMGAIWLGVHRTQENVPRSPDGWRTYLQRCVRDAELFQQTHGSGFSSTLSVRDAAD